MDFDLSSFGSNDGSGLANLDITDYVNMEQLNSIINRANEIAHCDAACKKAKKIERLEKDYKKILKEDEDYDDRLAVAKEAYFKAAMGENGFRKHVKREVTEIANEKSLKISEEFEKDIFNLVTLLDNLEQAKLSGEMTRELIEEIEKENKKIEKKIEKDRNKIAINNRMSVYEYNHITTIDFFNDVFKKVMIAVFIVYLGVFIYFRLGYSRFNIGILVMFGLIVFYPYFIMMLKFIYNAFA